MTVVVLVLVLALVLALLGWAAVRLRAVQDARALVVDRWWDLDEALAARLDVVARLVARVRADAGHEARTIQAVLTARTALRRSGDEPPQRRADLEDELVHATARLLDVTSAYPALRDDGAFARLRAELADADHAVRTAADRYDVAVDDLDTLLASGPTHVLAHSRGIAPAEAFGDPELVEPPGDDPLAPADARDDDPTDPVDAADGDDPLERGDGRERIATIS